MIDKQTIFQVDSFTSEPFKGNPAGVMVVDNDTPTEWMQAIAAEMNLSETAFIIPQNEYFAIRFFTPTNEVPLCGHATLASAHILYEKQWVKPNDTIWFKAQGGDLMISKVEDYVAMNFPAYPFTKIQPFEDFKTIVGFEPIEMYTSIYGWVIALAQIEQEIALAAPNFELMKTSNLGHVMITAQSDREAFDFVVRCFAPSMGINEDPVTGSAHCALTPLWAAKLNKNEMNSLQLSKRTGNLTVKLINDRVEIKGKAITIFEAKLKIVNA